MCQMNIGRADQYSGMLKPTKQSKNFGFTLNIGPPNWLNKGNKGCMNKIGCPYIPTYLFCKSLYMNAPTSSEYNRISLTRKSKNFWNKKKKQLIINKGKHRHADKPNNVINTTRK